MLKNLTQLNTKKTNKAPLMTKGLSKHPPIPDSSKEDADKKDEMGLDVHSIKETVQRNIEYEFMVQRHDKERLQRIDSTHIEYVFECLDKNTTFIRNIKKYLLTALFNAPFTIDIYYIALVKHDLYGSGSRFYETLGSLMKSHE